MGKILPQTFPLFESWIADLQLNRPIKPFSELFVAPLHEFMVTNLIARLINSKISGETFNLTAKDSLAYSEIAGIIAEYLNFDKNLVKAVPLLKTVYCGSRLLPIWIAQKSHSCLKLSYH